MRWSVEEGKEGCPMFLGTHAPRLDQKGRLILPAKFRDELAGGVVLTRGQEHCLGGVPGSPRTGLAPGDAHDAALFKIICPKRICH